MLADGRPDHTPQAVQQAKPATNEAKLAQHDHRRRQRQFIKSAGMVVLLASRKLYFDSANAATELNSREDRV